MSGRDTLARPTAPQRPCTGANAVLFETDTGDARTWAAAAARCDRCPFLPSCRADLEAAHPDWGPGRRPGNPCAVVWAGLIFGCDRRLWTRRGLVRAVAAAGVTARGARRDDRSGAVVPLGAPHAVPVRTPRPAVDRPTTTPVMRAG